MIKVTDHLFTDNKIYLILYVSHLLSYVQIIVNRNSDLPKIVEQYKDLENINKYLNGEII